MRRKKRIKKSPPRRGETFQRRKEKKGENMRVLYAVRAEGEKDGRARHGSWITSLHWEEGGGKKRKKDG